MKKMLYAAILGLALSASTAQAQFRIGVNVSSNFGTTSYYPARVYDGGYYARYPSYYYYSAPSYYGYSGSPGFYYSTPGFSIGVGRPYDGGYGYYGGGWNGGYRGYRGVYRSRWR